MEHNFEYKEDILSTRKGCVGSSDARMLMQIASLGSVPKSSYDRLAVVKGLTEAQEHAHSAAMNYGDEIEMDIYSYLSSAKNGASYESNPRWESERYSRKNVKCIMHPDIVQEDKEKKILRVYEVKTSKYKTQEVRNQYRAQLFYESLLAKERAEKLGRGWQVQMYLVHYCTDGLNLEDDNAFDPQRMTIKRVVCQSHTFDLGKAMDTIDSFLETMTPEMVADNVIDAEYLPVEVRNQFTDIAIALREIKAREAKVEEFKKKLYSFLSIRGVKKVKCDSFAFTLVEPTQSVTFDAKKWWEEYSANISEKEVEDIRSKYNKTINKNGYVKITVSEK